MNLLTAAQVAARWQCSTKTVHRLVAAGQLAAVQLGTGAKSRRFDPVELDRYLESQRQPQCQSASATAYGRSMSGSTASVLASLLAPKRPPSKPKENCEKTPSARRQGRGEGVGSMTREALIKELAEKFCRWPLPETVCADLCATKARTEHRTGTNLLSTLEARQMLAYVLDGVALAVEDAAGERNERGD